jgi:hypothetical protein
MALGYIAAFSETLALAVIASDGLPPLLDALTTEIEDHIKSASAWSLGQIGRHTPNHAKAVAEVNTLQALVHCFIAKTSSEDLQTKCKKALKGICDRLTYFPALDAVIQVSLHRGFLCRVFPFTIKKSSITWGKYIMLLQRFRIEDIAWCTRVSHN